MAALDAILSTLRPAELTLSPELLRKMPPRPDGYAAHREMFPRFTGPGFDPVSPAMVAANHVLSTLLASARAARLVTQHAVDPSLPGFGQVLDKVIAATFDAPAATPYEAEVSRAIERVAVDTLIDLAQSAPMPQVRALAQHRLTQIRDRSRQGDRQEAEQAHAMLLAADIQRFLDRPLAPAPSPASPEPPPGAPIGDAGPTWISDWDACRYWRDTRPVR
jgi:hypothetical protein